MCKIINCSNGVDILGSFNTVINNSFTQNKKGVRVSGGSNNNINFNNFVGNTKFGVKNIKQPGFEADDIIGTLSKKVAKEHPDMGVVIVTGDMDTLQLVTDQISVYAPKRGMSDPISYDKKANVFLS
mgnify:CR=1 FL=1